MTELPQQFGSLEREEGTHADWYRPGHRIAEFHRSKARIRALIGSRGSGKTTSLAVEVVGHSWHNAGAKTYVLRKTQSSNADTSQETFEMVFKKCGSAYEDTGLSLFKKIEGGTYYRLPSARAVALFNTFLKQRPNKTQTLQWLATVGDRYCSFLQFAGVPDAGKRATRFRGYECSLLIFVEADELAKEDLDMALACLRWKDADGEFIEDTCCVLDTNPPSPRHWIAELEEETKDDPDYQWWHIPIDDNEHNLPPGYAEGLRRTYRGNPAMYRRMILGEYAEAFDGNRVLWAFSEQHGYDNLPFPRGAYLVRSWDFGVTQANVWSAYWCHEGTEYWWDLAEHYAEGSDVEKQCREVVSRTAEMFPFYNDRSVCAGVYDACDPAGNQRTDKGKSLDVLRTYQVYPKFSTKFRSLQLTLSAYNRLLEAKDPAGNLVYRIDRVNCPMLYLASLGGYRYPNVGEPGYGKDEPGKGPTFGNYDHVTDSSRYGKVNFLRLMEIEMEKMQRPVGALARPVSVNPKRRYR